jgi:sulfur-oxidizing protein SoxB
MTSRREFLQTAAALAAIVPGGWSRAFAQQRLRQADLIDFEPLGNVTLVHIADLHAQLVPIYFREPSVNLGVGDARGRVPHLTGGALLDLYGIRRGSPLAHALSAEDFTALAKAYGRMGGLDRIATVLAAIRAERADRVAFLDGGDTWQNSYTSLVSKGQDMVDCMAMLRPDAMVGHWEFTLGAQRVKEIVQSLGFPFLALNVRDTEWDEPVFPAMTMIERGGVAIAVLGQAYPYTPIANPRWMIPSWSFGIREGEVRAQVEKARAAGAELVVLLSHNGFDIDRKLAARVPGIDVVLTAHGHDALPAVVEVGSTLLVASGSHGKFVSRLDLDVRGGAVQAYRFKLIPIFADAIAPEPEMAARIAALRAPHIAHLGELLGRAGTLLYRRGNFNGTLDDQANGETNSTLGASGVVFALQFPKMGIGLGFTSANAIAYVDLLASIGESTGSLIALQNCATYNLAASLGAGLEAQIGLGKFGLSVATPRKIIFPADGKQFTHTDGAPECPM